MKSRKYKRWIRLLGGGVFFTCFFILVLPYFLSAEYAVVKTPEVITKAEEVKVEEVRHISTPDSVKAIYMTACVASMPSWRGDLLKFINKTELNAVVIDIKDYTGTVSFIDPSYPGGKGCRVKDLKEFIKELHKENIYVIGRIAVFQDTYYASAYPELAVKSRSTGEVWKDRKGLPFIDVSAKPYWDHIIKLSIASYEQGFDEVNFDYVRYPTDGNVKDANFTWMKASTTKPVALEEFFSYLHNSLKDTGVKTSADLFGIVTISESDMGIGQVLERALPYFDYIYPMVYPSHFGAGINNIQKPAENPYEIIKYSMGEGVKREQAWNIREGRATSTPSKLRPWLQDFDLGADYGTEEVRAQIQATYDAGLNGWLMWDASNKYTREAYLSK